MRARPTTFFVRLRELYPDALPVRVEVECLHYGEDSGHPPALLLAQFMLEPKRYNCWLNKQGWVGPCVVSARGALGFSDPSFYRSDGVHLNLRGLQMLARGLINAVRRLCNLLSLAPLVFAFGRD